MMYYDTLFCLIFQVESMSKKGEVQEQSCAYEQLKMREEVEVILRKLQILKSRISELRTRYEENSEGQVHKPWKTCFCAPNVEKRWN